MTTLKRNTVKVNSNGNYLMTGLNKKEKESLKSKREELKKRIDSSVVDQYIIALYSIENNEVYFVDPSSYSSDKRAILL
jgi:hypothetical protein